MIKSWEYFCCKLQSSPSQLSFQNLILSPQPAFQAIFWCIILKSLCWYIFLRSLHQWESQQWTLPFCKADHPPYLEFRTLWWEFFTWVKEDTVLHNSPMANFLQLSTTTGGKDITRRRKIWWLATTKSIWQFRNDLVFHNQAFDIHKLVDNSIFLTWTWLKGWEKNFCVPFHHWSSAMPLAFV